MLTYSERAHWDDLDGMFSSKSWKLANFEKNTKAIAHCPKPKLEISDPRDNEKQNIYHLDRLDESFQMSSSKLKSDNPIKGY